MKVIKRKIEVLKSPYEKDMRYALLNMAIMMSQGINEQILKWTHSKIKNFISKERSSQFNVQFSTDALSVMCQCARSDHHDDDSMCRPVV